MEEVKFINLIFEGICKLESWFYYLWNLLFLVLKVINFYCRGCFYSFIEI